MSRALAWIRFRDLCWACSLGRCGQAPNDNLCECCRANHHR